MPRAFSHGYYSTIEAARALGVSMGTVHRWCREGKVTPARNEHGWRLFTEHDLQLLWPLALRLRAAAPELSSLDLQRLATLVRQARWALDFLNRLSRDAQWHGFGYQARDLRHAAGLADQLAQETHQLHHVYHRRAKQRVRQKKRKAQRQARQRR